MAVTHVDISLTRQHYSVSLFVDKPEHECLSFLGRVTTVSFTHDGLHLTQLLLGMSAPSGDQIHLSHCDLFVLISCVNESSITGLPLLT